MAAPINNNIDTQISSSQPNLSCKTPLTNKRSQPDSPDNLPATQKQSTRQIRRRNSVSDLSDIVPKRGQWSKKSITDKVLETLTSSDVLDKVIPILSAKISETITSVINSAVESNIQKCVEKHIRPLTATITKQQQTIDQQQQTIQEQNEKISVLERNVKDQALALEEHGHNADALYKKMSELEIRIESQEQYSRRTSLRFHNVSVPVDINGRITHPVDTDDLVLKICNDKLGLNIMKNDIGRSHVIGKVRDGKSQVIVRFLSYRTRNEVFSNKKALKSDPNKVFITENLTKFRTELVKKLSELKYNGQIYTYWTADGRIYVKVTTNSRKQVIKNHDDILYIIRNHLNQSDGMVANENPPRP